VDRFVPPLPSPWLSLFLSLRDLMRVRKNHGKSLLICNCFYLLRRHHACTKNMTPKIDSLTSNRGMTNVCFNNSAHLPQCPMRISRKVINGKLRRCIAILSLGYESASEPRDSDLKVRGIYKWEWSPIKFPIRSRLYTIWSGIPAGRLGLKTEKETLLYVIKNSKRLPPIPSKGGLFLTHWKYLLNDGMICLIWTLEAKIGTEQGIYLHWAFNAFKNTISKQ